MLDTNDMAFEAIKAMFETGKIKKMKQLEKLSPTKMAKALGLNYGRYIRKLYNPELFVIAELKKLSKIVDTKFRTISEVVISEVDN
jgi:3-methyladenine DNA glycosylase Mpg